MEYTHSSSICFEANFCLHALEISAAVVFGQSLAEAEHDGGQIATFGSTGGGSGALVPAKNSRNSIASIDSSEASMAPVRLLFITFHSSFLPWIHSSACQSGVGTHRLLAWQVLMPRVRLQACVFRKKCPGCGSILALTWSVAGSGGGLQRATPSSWLNAEKMAARSADGGG